MAVRKVMRIPYLEKPADFSKPQQYCAFRWCTEEAVTELWVHIHEAEDVEPPGDAIQVPVCPQHRNAIEKYRDKKGAR